MSLNVCCAPMPAIIDLYPPSICTRVGRLLERIVTWAPTNATLIGLSLGILSATPMATNTLSESPFMWMPLVCMSMETLSMAFEWGALTVSLELV